MFDALRWYMSLPTRDPGVAHSHLLPRPKRDQLLDRLLRHGAIDIAQAPREDPVHHLDRHQLLGSVMRVRYGFIRSMRDRDTSGSLEMAACILRAGVDLDRPFVDPTGEMPGGPTPLTLAVGSVDLEMARLLLDAGADPDKPDGNGRTARQVAAFVGLSEYLVVEKTCVARRTAKNLMEGLGRGKGAAP